MGHPKYTMKEIRERGHAWYDQTIRSQIDEVANRGKALIIDIETGEYEMGDDGLAATQRALAKHSDAVLFGMRIGYPAYAKIGGGWGNLNR